MNQNVTSSTKITANENVPYGELDSQAVSECVCQTGAGDWIVDLSLFPSLDKSGTQDTSSVIQQAINYALFSIERAGRNPINKSYANLTIQLPAGVFLIKESIHVNMRINSTGLGDQLYLTFKGASGKNGTILNLDTSCPLMFSVPDGKITFQDFKAQGHSNGNFMEIGKQSALNGRFQVVSQSTFSNFEVVYFNKGFIIGQMFDSSFYDVGIFNMTGIQPVAIDILPHDNDNTNNLMFYRLHVEQAIDGMFFRAKGVPQGSQNHNNFGFFGCHFEARSYNTIIIDVEACNRIGFYNTQFTHNNTQGASSGITLNNLVPMVKMTNVQGMIFDNCTMTIQGTSPGQTPPCAMFQLSGKVRSVNFRGGHIHPGLFSTSWGIDALYQSSTNNPYDSSGEDWATFTNVHPDTNSAGTALFNANDTIAKSTNRNFKWNRRVNIENNDLEFGFTSTSNKSNDWKTPSLAIDTSSMLKVRSLSSLNVKTIGYGETEQFNFPAKSNSSRRGLYILTCDAPYGCCALFFSSGSDLFLLNGTDTAANTGKATVKVNVSATDAGTPDQVSVFLTGGANINVTNRSGVLGSRKFSLIMIGF